jgi:hypothetical protein
MLTILQESLPILEKHREFIRTWLEERGVTRRARQELAAGNSPAPPLANAAIAASRVGSHP